MINDVDYQAATAWLRQFRRPLIISHQRPDGDAIGSLAALALALKQLAIEPFATLFDPIPPRYDFLKDHVAWYLWDEVRDVVKRECDAVIILDTCAFAQLEPAAEFLQQCPETLVVDHHLTRDRLAHRDGDLQLIDVTAAATSVIIAEWFASAGLTVDSPIATALFTGIATDCGWFRFSNTDARTMRLAAGLVEQGVAVSDLYDQIHQQEPLPKLRLISRLLDSMELFADGKLAVLRLRPADFAAVGADRSMTDDLVNEASRLAGVEATIMFTEESDGLVKANFRSKSFLDVSALASRYGGGGHARAAGARIHGQWDSVVPRLIAEAVEMIDASP